jgi:hypothetical protein
MEKLAAVPYAPGKSYDFYEDMCVINDEEISYNDIDGFGYLLTHRQNSIYFVPIANSTNFTFNIALGNRNFNFGRSASGLMFFKGQNQKTVDLVFLEVYKCFFHFIAPLVFEKCIHQLRSKHSLKIGNLTISTTGLSKKGMFKEKSIRLSEYSHTTIAGGRIVIHTKDGKQFYSTSLSVINAPLIGDIIDKMLGIERN